MKPRRVLLLGCGYTGRRIAGRLVSEGHEVCVTMRSIEGQDVAGTRVVRFDTADDRSYEDIAGMVDATTLVIHSIPPDSGSARVVEAIRRARRIVYLSSTGVYGEQGEVNELTPADPQTERQVLRREAEKQILDHPNALVLRAAAIYGPFRGIHHSMRRGTSTLPGKGANFVSRIHVEDLAAQAHAALLSNINGPWPVADEEPCTARDMAEYCAGLLQVPMPPLAPIRPEEETRRADRKVDGRAIRKLLGVELRYPTYRVGVPACIEVELTLR